MERSLLFQNLTDYGGKFLFPYNSRCSDVNNVPNIFIRDVCHAWALLNYDIPEENYGNQIVLNNASVKIGNNMLYSKRLLLANAYHRRGSIEDTGGKMQFQSFRRNYVFPFL